MQVRSRSRRSWLLSGGSGITAGLVIGALVALSGIGAPLQPAQADSSSAVTHSAKEQDPDYTNAPFPDLSVTLSQTKGLTSQGVVLDWTGGRQSVLPGNGGGENFLQIAQCWGDDPDDPSRPDRTTCEYGGFGAGGSSSVARDSFVSDPSLVASQDADYTAPGSSFADPTYTAVPFRSVDNVVVAGVENHVRTGVDVNTNQFFTKYTSNEVTWAGSGTKGDGSAKFEIQTAMQAPGLGCGNTVKDETGQDKPRSCWLVVIPRGSADVGEQHITKSGLFWDTWKHSIAFRLDFAPLGVTCAIGAAERALSGSELLAGAVSSWQPSLCSSQGGAAFTISTGADSDAELAASGTTAAPLALTSRPLDTSATGSPDPLKYAPVALSGVSIAFAVDRHPIDAPGTPADVLDTTGLPYTSLKLTPRLVAKLLTNSYWGSLPTNADLSHLGANPRNLHSDPDFLAVNDSAWKYETVADPSISDLLLPQGRSDAAWQLWSYVLSDQSAVDFLNGKPDDWGMKVNPYSNMDAAQNPTGTGLTLPRDNFPKADPVEQAAGAGSAGAGPVNLVTFRPYTNDLDTSGYLTLRGDGQTLGIWDPTSVPPKYAKSVRSLTGFQAVLGLTDTASAEKYQVISASLLNAAGKYVAPTVESLTAAAAAMTANPAQPQVYGYDPGSAAAKAAPSAYPLAMPVYAATNPAQKDPTNKDDPEGTALRADYAMFIRYAATSGQAPGISAGLLPPGYAPIPQGWRDQALAAADAIQSGITPTPRPSATPKPRPATQPNSTRPPSAPNQAPIQVPPPASGNTPAATGQTAPSLVGAATPADPESAVSAALPVTIVAGLLAAGLVPILTRIRRRRP